MRDFSLIFNEFSTFQAATQSLLHFVAAMLSLPLLWEIGGRYKVTEYSSLSEALPPLDVGLLNGERSTDDDVLCLELTAYSLQLLSGLRQQLKVDVPLFFGCWLPWLAAWVWRQG